MHCCCINIEILQDARCRYGTRQGTATISVQGTKIGWSSREGNGSSVRVCKHTTKNFCGHRQNADSPLRNLRSMVKMRAVTPQFAGRVKMRMVKMRMLLRNLRAGSKCGWLFSVILRGNLRAGSNYAGL